MGRLVDSGKAAGVKSAFENTMAHAHREFTTTAVAVQVDRDELRRNAAGDGDKVRTL